MNVQINGRPELVPDHATVEQLLEFKHLARQACAVEVNKVLVPKKKHREHRLQEGDRIEIVTLVGGG